MSETGRMGDLELNQDLGYQRRSWIVQRYGWVLMMLIVLAAVLGLFGQGIFSQVIAGQPNDLLWAEYHRFWRFKSPMSIRVHISDRATRDGQVSVWIARSYMEAVSIQHVMPQPQRVELGGDRLTYVFNVSDLSPSAAIVFRVEPEKFGSISGKVGLKEGPVVDVRQFIYP